MTSKRKPQPMPRIITRLTPEQEADLVDHREIWRAHGLSTQPADFDRAKGVITDFYRRIGKPPPMFLCFSSPMMCVLAIAAIKQLAKRAPKGAPLSKLKLSSQLSSQLYSQLYSQLSSQLYSQLSSQLSSQLYSQLYSQLDSQLYSQLYSQISSQLYSQNLRDAWGRYHRFAGQHLAYYIAFYSFAAKIGVKFDADHWRIFQGWAALAESVCWWSPYDGVCIISDRPRKASFDAERRLHCETGAAIQFSDGWGMHAWHGQRVPAEWIDDKPSLTAKTALTWENVEQRRAACEILGWHRILAELDAKTIDRDAEATIGELVEVTLDGQRERFIKVLCGTGREFALPVPPTMQTALQANAWTYGIDDAAKFVKPEVRT